MNERLTENEMAARIAEMAQRVPTGAYRHANGDLYEVFGYVLDATNDQQPELTAKVEYRKVGSLLSIKLVREVNEFWDRFEPFERCVP